MSPCCRQDLRRDAIRRAPGRNGLDYVEVRDDQRTLEVYFLGKLPAELRTPHPGLSRYLRIEGGDRVTGLSIIGVEPVASGDPQKDDVLLVQLDRPGDFSRYTLRLVGVRGIDAGYDRAEFAFHLDCPSDLDCAPSCACEPPVFDDPVINYLA